MEDSLSRVRNPKPVTEVLGCIRGGHNVRRIVDARHEHAPVLIETQRFEVKFSQGGRLTVHVSQPKITLPVSYTHLDVYKRQLLSRVSFARYTSPIPPAPSGETIS